jgi:FAD:protein FMN transferase
MLVVTLNP